MKKKLITCGCVWLAGLLGFAYLLGAGTHFFITKAAVADADFSRYKRLAKVYENPDNADQESQLKGTIVMRSALSDEISYYQEDSGVGEYAVRFLYPGEEQSLARGTWSALSQKEEGSHHFSSIKGYEAGGLISWEELNRDGVLDKLHAIYSEYQDVNLTERPYVVVEQFAKKGLVCYPLKMSVFAVDGEFIESYECFKDMDFSDYEIVEIEDGNVGMEVMDFEAKYEQVKHPEKNLSSAAADKKYQELLKKGASSGKTYSGTMFSGTWTTWDYDGTYGIIHSDTIQTEKIAWAVIKIGVGLWSTLMLIVTVVTVFVKKKNR